MPHKPSWDACNISIICIYILHVVIKAYSIVNIGDCTVYKYRKKVKVEDQLREIKEGLHLFPKIYHLTGMKMIFFHIYLSKFLY